MSITVPTSKQSISVGSYSVGKPVRASEYHTLAKQQHYVFSRSGTRVQGLVWDYGTGGGTPFQTTSATFDTADDNGNRNLDTFWPPVTLPRRSYYHNGVTYVSGVSLTLKIIGENIRVKMTARAADTDADLGNVTATCASGGGTLNASQQLDLTWANSHIGGSTSNDLRVICLRFEARYDAATTGYLWGLTATSSILTSLLIPSAEP